MTEFQQDINSNPIKPKKGRFWVVLLSVALAIVVFAFGLRLFVFDHYRVEGISMTPTIEHNASIWVNRLKVPKRFDIVAIEAATYNDAAERQIIANGGEPLTSKPEKLLKRIVGIAGDTLSVDAQKYLVIETDGVKTYLGQEDYGNGKLDCLSYWLNGKENFTLKITVPEGFVFVLGDFRGRSEDMSVSVDSRMFGLVSLSDIVGVVV